MLKIGYATNSRTKSVAIFLSLPIADSYRKKMLKCGKWLGIIYCCSFVIFLGHERKVIGLYKHLL